MGTCWGLRLAVPFTYLVPHELLGALTRTIANMPTSEQAHGGFRATRRQESKTPEASNTQTTKIGSMIAVKPQALGPSAESRQLPTWASGGDGKLLRCELVQSAKGLLPESSRGDLEPGQGRSGHIAGKFGREAHWGMWKDGFSCSFVKRRSGSAWRHLGSGILRSSTWFADCSIAGTPLEFLKK